MLLRLLPLIIFFKVSSCFAQWSTNTAVNNSVCVLPASSRFDERVVSDGNGGAIIVWMDNRTGQGKLYAQRIDFYGNVQWATNGIPLCTSIANQYNPAIVADGSGGAIIAWGDNRNSALIYAQHINSSGTLLWPVSGVPICNLTYSQADYPSITTDGNGGAIIAWTDQRLGSADIYAQRVNAYGAVQWATNGVPICNVIRSSWFSKIVSDGAGGAIISWEDTRYMFAVYQQSDIFAQRVNASGVIQWALDGVPICLVDDEQVNICMVSDNNGGAVMTWKDHRAGLDDIYAQWINSAGVVQGPTDGAAICTSAYGQANPKVILDGAGGAFIAWDDHRTGGGSDIYVQRINNLVQSQWSVNGKLIATGPVGRGNPEMLSDGFGGAFISWGDGRSSVGSDIYAQRINSSGVGYWTANGILIGSAVNNQHSQLMVSDYHNGVIMAWFDDRRGLNSKDIYAQRINPNGYLCNDPIVDLGSDISTCFGVTMLDAGNVGSSYLWSTGATSQTLVVSTSTLSNYYVTVTNPNGCYTTDFVNIVPNAMSVPSGSVCIGSSYTLNPSGASTYTFSSGSAIVSPTVPTSYTVIGTSAQGCVDTAYCWVGINNLPVVSVPSGSICSGASYTMAPSGAYTYTLSSMDVIVTPTATSSYSIVGISVEGCMSSNTAVCEVTVNPRPVITAPSGTICAGTSFTIIPTGATTYTYSGGSSVVNPPSNSYYTVIGTNSLGCVNTPVAGVTITVNPKPAIAVNSGSICEGKSFTMTPSGAISYSYSSGSAIVSPTINTTYTVTGSNSYGCVSNGAVSTVTVKPMPLISINSGSICEGSSFTITPDGAATYTYSSGSAIVSPTINSTYTVAGTSSVGCVNSSGSVSSVTVNTIPLVTLSNNTLCAGNSFTLNPSGANTYTYSGASAIVTPTITTSYSVSGASSEGCVSSVVVATITVNNLPIVNASSSNTIICSGETTSLIATGATSYIWNTNEVTPIIAISPSVTTVYTVQGTDSNGCVNAAAITQSVSTCTEINAITKDLNVSVYPNPNQGQLFITLYQESNVSLFDALGNLVFNYLLTEGVKEINMMEQPCGIYFLIIEGESGLKPFKIIKD